MPLVENDLFYAYLKEGAKHSEIAEQILRKISDGKIRDVYSSTLCLIELALLYKTVGEEQRLTQDLAKLTSIGGIKWMAIGAKEILVASELRRELNLGFWDSHYAAVALLKDKTVISFDEVYDRVPGLKRLDPYKL
jgi:predicted nucleic acid-binding protein